MFKKLSILVLVTVIPQSVNAAESVAELFERVKDSVVVIETREKGLDQSGRWDRQVDWGGIGTGFIVSEAGDILTAAHVVHNADRVIVHMADGEKYLATIHGTDVESDVARLTLVDPPESLQVVELADSDEVRVGDPVFVIGAPYGYSHTLTLGNISGRRLEEGRRMSAVEFFQTDAAINRGNSGGPMFNEDGEVIGIVSYIVSSSGDFAGLGFATTINIANDLMFNQPHWWLGIEFVPVTDRLASALNVPQPFGLLVQRVADGSIGHHLRIRPGNLPVSILDRELLLGGDIILSVAGIELTGDGGQVAAIREASQQIPNKGRFEITVWREGKVVTLYTTKDWN